MTRIPIRFGFWRWLLTILGTGPRFSHVDIGRDEIRVRMGWAFRARFARSMVATAQRHRRAISIGAHGWRGRWLVNGASGPLVGIVLREPVPARVCGFRIHLREVIVSVDDPDALLAALR